MASPPPIDEAIRQDRPSMGRGCGSRQRLTGRTRCKDEGSPDLPADPGISDLSNFRSGPHQAGEHYALEIAEQTNV